MDKTEEFITNAVKLQEENTNLQHDLTSIIKANEGLKRENIDLHEEQILNQTIVKQLQRDLQSVNSRLLIANNNKLN